jgi:spoIIIJ-associated protein
VTKVHELPSDPGDRVAELVELVLDALDLDGEVVIDEAPERLTVTVEGDDLGLVIGRRGQTIDALQHLAQRIAYVGIDERKRVIVDAAGYRARRAKELGRVGDQAAETALKTGRPVKLDPMTPQERKVVHEHLRDRHDVETYSEGDEPQRRLVVAPVV